LISENFHANDWPFAFVLVAATIWWTIYRRRHVPQVTTPGPHRRARVNKTDTRRSFQNDSLRLEAVAARITPEKHCEFAGKTGPNSA
jgi:hypothetical protein